ncbi:uncharacterized protein CBL_00419 [Carabus blaptoides fortunei]
MRCVTVFTVVVALLGALCLVSEAQFLNNRPYPTYSLEQMPDTGFSCRDKVLGGYYADSETQCQMFHVCVKVAGLGVQDFRFLCPNGTAFDQDSQICADWDDVDCEAATLYYSSDNFDLYRVGSGYETAAFAGEDEGTFHLQRSDTGDARLIREHQSQKINQQANYNTAVPPKRPTPHGRPTQDQDILRGSHSSNFFNNRNGGKETEDDYYSNTGAPNQNSDIPKKKVIRKFNNRKPVEDSYDDQTQKPSKPTAFSNNFAGSVPSSTARTAVSEQYSTTNNYRGRQAGRAAPFRQTPESKQYKNVNRQSTQYNNQNDNGQYNPTTAAPKPTYNIQYDTPRVRQQPQAESATTAAVKPNSNNQYQSKQTDNYSSTTLSGKAQTYNNQYQNKQTDNYSSTAISGNAQTYTNQYQNKQTENYPSTASVNKQSNQYPSTASVNKQNNQYPSTAAPFRQPDYNKQTTQYKKETENYPTTPGFTNKQNYNTQYDVQKKPTTQAKQTENYQTTFAPSKQTYQKSTTQYYQPKETENYTTTAEGNNKQYDQHNTKQTTQYNNQYNSQSTVYTKQTDYSRTQYQNSQTTQYSQQYSNTSKPTTQHTQYTPTVPKQTTQYQYSSTTPSAARFSKQYDETSYDDGSYSDKYDDEKYKQEDEFLKTAHSQNFASARNEYISSSTKGGNRPTTQSPRPFSITTPAPSRGTSPPRQTQTVPKTTAHVEKKQSPPPKVTEAKAPELAKKKEEKDASYDYAYYDSNVGSEPDYEIGTEFQRSTKKTN